MGNRRIRVLFVAECATLAHVVRPFLLAQSLPQDKFEVHFASDSYFDFVTKSAPFKLHKINSRSPGDFQKTLSEKGILFDADLVRKYVKEELALFANIRPDVVVGDLRPSLTVSAPISGVAHASLTNAYWSPFSAKRLPAMFSSAVQSRRWLQPWAKATLRKEQEGFWQVLPHVFAAQAAGLDQIRKEYGLPPFPDYLTGFTWGDITLFSDTRSLVKLRNLPSNHRFIGPVTWSAPVEPPKWWGELSGRSDIIYLSLGSSGLSSLIPSIIKALSPFKNPIVMSSAGGAIQTGLPKNFYTAQYLPGDLILKSSSLAITNGGSPSTYQAFQAGVPVLGLPTNMDQLLCMEHAQEAGPCISIRGDLATKSNIREAINRILIDKQFTQRANAVKSEIQSYKTDSLFADCLLELTSSRATTSVNQ